MKMISILCVLAALGCSPARQASRQQESIASVAAVSPHAAPALLHIVADGEPYSLRFEAGYLDFCDTRGSRKLELKSGHTVAAEFACKQDEANPSCSGYPLDLTVRSPMSQPNDIVDSAGSSFPMKGRVHDCAVDGENVAVITASSVALIDPAKGKMVEVHSHGGQRVAAGFGWVAWTDDSNLYAAKSLLVVSQQ